MGKEILDTLMSRKRKSSSRIGELIEIRRELQRIGEQQDLSIVLERLDKIVNQQTVIINLLNAKLDLDSKEAELMDLIRAKVEAGG